MTDQPSASADPPPSLLDDIAPPFPDVPSFSSSTDSPSPHDPPSSLPSPLSSSHDSTSPPSHPSSTPPTMRRRLDQNKMVNQNKRKELEKRMDESRLFCHDSIRLFAECATGRSFSTVWACWDQNKEMHRCMRDYMDQHPKPLLP